MTSAVTAAVVISALFLGGRACLTRKRSLVRAQYRAPLVPPISGLVVLVVPIRAQFKPTPVPGECG